MIALAGRARWAVSRAVGLLPAAALGAWVLCGAAAGSQDEKADPPPPPAVFTARLSAVSNIEGDSFDFSPDLEPIRIRLRDATCEGLDEKTRKDARFIAAGLLEGQPFWIFPAGELKAGSEVPARVWTAKGWLSEVLIKARLAKRCEGAAAVTLKPAEAREAPRRPPDPPPAPAFAAPIDAFLAGDRFEVRQEGQARRLRLYDASAEAGGAVDLAKQAIGSGPVWIFPSSQRRLKPEDDLPVRIWTRQGWLADVLVKAGAARQYADPDEAVAERTAPPEAVAPVRDPPSRQPRDPPPAVEEVWREVAVEKASGDSLSVESKTFRIPGPEWRLAWNVTPVRTGGHIILNIYYVRPEWTTRMSHNAVKTFKGPAGAGLVRYTPGDFYIRITGTTELNVKVEYKEAAPAGG